MMRSTSGLLKKSARRILGDHHIRRIKAHRLRLYERIGAQDHLMIGLNDLDRLLIEEVVGNEDDTFLEFGANDGLQQSNTYRLERDHCWRGVLIEPVPELAAECLRNRPLAQVVTGAVSSKGSSGKPLGVVSGDLMSQVGQSRQYAVGIALSDVISDLLDGHVGLVSIDVEGFEIDVLAGLDLDQHRPDYLLIETSRPDEIVTMLSKYYEMKELSYHDYLFTKIG